jgi:hypothetical protein
MRKKEKKKNPMEQKTKKRMDLGNLCDVLHSGWTNLHFQQCRRAPVSPYPYLPAFVIIIIIITIVINFFIIAILIVLRWYLVVLIFISRMTNDFEHFSIYLFFFF